MMIHERSLIAVLAVMIHERSLIAAIVGCDFFVAIADRYCFLLRSLIAIIFFVAIADRMFLACEVGSFFNQQSGSNHCRVMRASRKPGAKQRAQPSAPMCKNQIITSPRLSSLF